MARSDRPPRPPRPRPRRPGLEGWILPWCLRAGRSGLDWTPLGLPDDGVRWTVDPRGRLAPAAGAWSIDWWVSAGDRWYVPAREAAVRQSLVGGAPVIETRLRVTGGDVVIRHWAAPLPTGAAVACIEVDNASVGPIALALCLRPFGPAGLGHVQRIRLASGRLSVEGIEALRSEIAPRHAALSDGAGGDVATVVLADGAAPAVDGEVCDPAGLATAALLWPLAPRDTLRVHVGGSQEHASGEAPGPDQVARGWAARVDRRPRPDLPRLPLAAAIGAQRPRLLLAAAWPQAAHEDRRRLGAAPVPVWSGRQDSALVVAALATSGSREEAAVWLDSWLADQHRSGRLGDDRIDTAATLWAIATWWGTSPDGERLVAPSSLAVARAAELIGRGRTRDDAILPTVWATAGLAAAAALLAAAGETVAAGRVGQWAQRRREVLLRDLPDGRAESARPAPGCRPEVGGVEEAVLAGLLAVHVGALRATDPRAARARRAARAASDPPGAVVVGAPALGASPYLSMLLAASSIRAGEDPSDEIAWLLTVAGPTWTWPSVVHAGTGAGRYGLGDDPLAGAAWWALARAILVDDGGVIPTLPTVGADDVSLSICPWLPSEWFGTNLEVHGLVTRAGPLSWALRWHGTRPALLWEIDGDGPGVGVRAPGLDPAWSAAGRRGEALLAACDDLPRGAG